MAFRFRGANVCNVDAKGRFALPTKHRGCFQEQGNEMSVLTIDTEDNCLLLYPEQEWHKVEAKLQALPSMHREVRRVQRLLIGHATDVEPDAQGRVLIPSLLREHAGIQKKLVLVGQGNKFELWSEDGWLHQREQWLASGRSMRENNEQVSDALADVRL